MSAALGTPGPLPDSTHMLPSPSMAAAIILHLRLCHLSDSTNFFVYTCFVSNTLFSDDLDTERALENNEKSTVSEELVR